MRQVVEEYVQERGGAWYVGHSGVQVYGVIALWQQGFSPEEIQSSFPSASLQEVYGCILYYLERREQMDAFFREQDQLFHHRKTASEAKNPLFYREMRERIARFRVTQSPLDPAADT